MKHKLHILKKLSAFIALAILLLSPGLGWGQIITFDFAGLAGSELSASSNSNDPNLTSSTITRGAGLTASGNADRFNATSWALTSIANAVSGNDYMEFSVTPNSGFQFSISSIVVQWQRSGTGNTGISLRSSVDNYATDLDAVKNVVDNTSTQTFTWTFTQSNSSSAVTYRFYSYAEATGGTGGPGDGTGNDILVYGTTSSTGGGLTPPALTADITNNDVDHNIDITFTDDATWRSLVTAVKIGGTALTVTTDYVLTAGNLQLKPSGGNPLLTTSGSKAVTVEATGYTPASVTQIINAGAATKLGITIQPTAPASNGAPLATQPVISIQDQYGNTTSIIATVVAAKYDAGSWTLGGTTSVDGLDGIVAFTDLTAASTTSVSGAQITFTSGSLTSIQSSTFNIPAPPTNLLFYDDFTGLTVGDNLAGQSSWTKSGSGPDPTIGNTTVLNYNGYNGGGNEYVIMPTATSTTSKVYKGFSPSVSSSTNTFYYSLLINLSSVTTTGDYFITLGDPNTGTTYFARLFAKSSGAGFVIGGSKLANVATAIFSSTIFDFNTTYAVVVRYTFVAGLANDLMYIWVNPSLSSEPLTSNAEVTIPSSDNDASLSTVGNFLWHNRTANNPVGSFDGTRVAFGSTSAVAWTYLDAYSPPPTASQWNGSASTDWFNPANWNNTGGTGYPGSTTDVTIPAGLTNYPTLTTFEACHNIAIESTAAGTATLLDNGYLTVNGTASVQRYFSGNTTDWHLVSSPMTNATANVFLGMYLQQYTASPTGIPLVWYTDITDQSTPLAEMEGYGLYSTTGNANTVTFTGTLNTGTRSHALSFNSNNAAFGWNLLGNPFPSSIDWEAVTIPSGMSSEVHYIEAATGADLSYVQNVGGGGSQYIAPMQGFFVSTTSAGLFSTGDSQRTHLGANNFYKSENPRMLVLQADGQNFSDNTFIHFNEQAGFEHDGVYDAYKIITSTNPELPQLFSYTPAGIKLSVNGMPETSSVQVGFTSMQSGTFTISAPKTGNFTKVLLEDLITGIQTDLLAKNYTFTYTAGENEKRFKVYFSTTGLNEAKTTSTRIYSYQHTVFINLNENKKGDIYIYNLTGQLVTSKASAQGMNEIKLPNTGNYLVRVISKDNTVVRKVFIQ